MFLQFLKKRAGLPLTLYGCWRPGIGWLRYDDKVYADVDKNNVKAVSLRCGGNARVEIVDEVLQSLSNIFLEQEQKVKK